MPRVRQTAKALAKGLEVLEAVAGAERALTLTELARALEYPKATAHRITRVLEWRGYLEGDPVTHAFRLGLKLWQLGHNVVNRLRLLEVARSSLEKLALETEEHVNLAVLRDGEAVFVDIIESPKPIRPYTSLGGGVPAYCSATGKAMLAFQSKEAVAAVIRKGLKPFTDRTIVQPARLQEELERIRSRGYALNLEEWREDVCGLAAPIWNHENKVVASVSITTPASRFDEEIFRPLVIASARGISRAIGWIETEGPPRLKRVSSKRPRTTRKESPRHGGAPLR